MIKSLFLSALSLLLLSCTYSETNEITETPTGISAEQQAFWGNLQQHCGNSYQSNFADATPYYQPFDAAETRVHFFNCSDEIIHIALHIGDNHSRNLLLTKTDSTLRLKHDHRNSDGSEETITMYGGDAPRPGLETRQIFWADDHTAQILPLRHDNFWFLDVMNDSTFAYGVHWPIQGNSIRIEFDITQTIDTPPTPWGY